MAFGENSHIHQAIGLTGVVFFGALIWLSWNYHWLLILVLFLPLLLSLLWFAFVGHIFYGFMAIQGTVLSSGICFAQKINRPAPSLKASAFLSSATQIT
jgi:hypothetical protein